MVSYTTFRIGGPARFLVECHERQDVIDAINLASEFKVDFFILGGGSNLLVSDKGYPGLIIHIASYKIKIFDNYLVADAGVNLEKLVDLCCRMGLGGLENLAGIKGTVGGAVYGNAGAFGNAIADCMLEAEIFSPLGQPRWEQKNYFAFSYRSSILKQTKETVLQIKLGFTKDSPMKLIAKQAEILALREQRHPDWDCSAGCYFKNIEKPDAPHGKLAAGFLLDQVGAKQMQVGGAKVFEKHANVLINSGSATAKDVRKLAELLKNKVKAEYGYNLEEEITFLGDY